MRLQKQIQTMNKKNDDGEAFTKPEIEKVRKGLQIFEDCSVFGEAMLKALKNVN